MSTGVPPQPSSVMFSLLPPAQPLDFFPTPARCRFYVRVHKQMTRRQFQLAVVYTLSTTPGLREWFVKHRAVWDHKVNELFREYGGEDKEVDGASAETCSICLGEEQAVKLLHECGHAFHTKCLHQWFRHGNSTCPCCRRVINITL